MNQCVDFITDHDSNNVILIISKAFIHSIVPVAQDISQVSYIHIMSRKKIQYEQWCKVRGVFTNIMPVYDDIKHVAQDCDQNMISISLGRSSMFTQRLK